MKILVTGATGQVGWELARSLAPLGQVLALDRSTCDLSHPDSLPALLKSIEPEVIVNAAAYTAVDRAEKEEDLAFTVNALAVAQLAQFAHSQRAFLIHFSTDYVFDGLKSTPYLESDPTGPLNAYGRSKLAGELALRDSDCDHLTLRSTWIYAARGQNFLRTILRLASQRPELKIVADQFGAPTWARHLADLTAHLLRQSLRARRNHHFHSEILHASAGNSTSWHRFAEAILLTAVSLGLLEQTPSLFPISTEEYPLPATRPKNSFLCSARLKERFGLALPNWQSGLSLCLEDLTPP